MSNLSNSQQSINSGAVRTPKPTAPQVGKNRSANFQDPTTEEQDSGVKIAVRAIVGFLVLPSVGFYLINLWLT